MACARFVCRTQRHSFVARLVVLGDQLADLRYELLDVVPVCVVAEGRRGVGLGAGCRKVVARRCRIVTGKSLGITGKIAEVTPSSLLGLELAHAR